MEENRTLKSPSLAPTSGLSGFGGEVRTTLLLAVPIIFGNILQNGLGVIDTLMVGHVSVTAVAAASLASALFVVPLVFGFGVLGPFSVFVAGAMARGEPAQAAHDLRRGLALAGVFGLIITVTIVGLSGYMDRLDQPPEVLDQARRFLLLLTCSIVPIYLFQILKQYCEALHTAWPPMVILTGGVFINIGLNWVFIFGHFGAPAMGLVGAGWATMIARLIVMLVMAAAVSRIHFQVPALREAFFRGAFQWRGYRDLLALGLPAGFQFILEVGAFTFAAIMMGWISEAALAAHQVAISVASTTFMVPMGLSAAVAIRVSHGVQSNEPVRARWCVDGSLLVALGFMSVMALIICLFAAQVAGLFIRDPRVIALAARLLFIAGLFQIFDGTQVICAAALRGFRDVKVPTLLTFGVYWLVALPISGALAFYFRWGAVGIWWGLLIGLVLISFFLVLRLRAKIEHALRTGVAEA